MKTISQEHEVSKTDWFDKLPMVLQDIITLERRLVELINGIPDIYVVGDEIRDIMSSLKELRKAASIWGPRPGPIWGARQI